jgi:hypothetical protein
VKFITVRWRKNPRSDVLQKDLGVPILSKRQMICSLGGAKSIGYSLLTSI